MAHYKVTNQYTYKPQYAIGRLSVAGHDWIDGSVATPLGYVMVSIDTRGKDGGAYMRFIHNGVEHVRVYKPSMTARSATTLAHRFAKDIVNNAEKK